MTDTDLNRAVAKKLNLPQHEFAKSSPIGNVCSCGSACGNLAEHIKDANPDFTQNAKVLLDAMKEKLGEEEHYAFMCGISKGITEQNKEGLGSHVHWYIDNTYILNPRQLCEKFLEWEGK